MVGSSRRGFGIVYLQTHPVPWDFSRAAIVMEISKRLPVLMIHPVAARTGYPRLVRGGVRGHPLSPRRIDPGRSQVDVQLLLPGGRFNIIGQANQRLIAAQARRAMRATGIDSGVLWFDQPRWWRMAEMLSEELLSLYDCTDLYSAFPGVDGVAARAVDAQEKRLMTTPGLAIAVSEPLRRRLAHFGDRPVAHIPHGFTLNGEDPAAILAGLRRPVIGLVGRLNDRYDFDLIEAVAGRFSDATVLLAGAVDRDSAAASRIAALEARPNVTVTGALTRPQAAALATAVDVGLIPYRDTAMNRFSDPVKMYDHLGGGVPVVASAVGAALLDQPLVRIGRNPADFLAAVASALGATLSPPGLRSWREENSTSARAGAVIDLLMTHAR